MAIFNIHCEDPWFSYIRQGVKTVEGVKLLIVTRKLRRETELIS